MPDRVATQATALPAARRDDGGGPFARDGTGHTRDFEDLVAWLVTKTDKTTVAGFARTSWRTVGTVCERVAANVLDQDRCAGWSTSVSTRSPGAITTGMTLVSDHDTGKIIWGKPGKDTATLHAFFDERPRQRWPRCRCNS